MDKAYIAGEGGFRTRRVRQAVLIGAARMADGLLNICIAAGAVRGADQKTTDRG